MNEVQDTADASSTFMGPSFWSADTNIFATVFQNNWVDGRPLGSHLGMLYWVIDGHLGNICRYDLLEDHGPGYDDHGAGKI